MRVRPAFPPLRPVAPVYSLRVELSMSVHLSVEG